MSLFPLFKEPAAPKKVIRLVKYGESIELPLGQLHIQQSPPRTGKTIRAKEWQAEEPANRRIVDGDRDEAQRLIYQGYDVMLNLLPGM